MRKYSHNRSDRIADQIQKDVVKILRLKVKDPRIEWVTINEVEVTDDYALAKIYWTVLNDDKRNEVAKALEVARGYIRSELSKGFKTYTIPQLRFIYDESLERGRKILDLLSDVGKELSEQDK